jgi:hypothetical protein
MISFGAIDFEKLIPQNNPRSTFEPYIGHFLEVWPSQA